MGVMDGTYPCEKAWIPSFHYFVISNYQYSRCVFEEVAVQKKTSNVSENLLEATSVSA